MFKHQIKTISAILSMKGPSEGRLAVELWVGEDSIGLFNQEMAIAIVRENKKFEYTAIERWIL